jgi:two-component system response regulator HydG
MPRVKNTPIVAGMLSCDPTVPIENRLRRLKGLGVSGVTNWPAVGFVDGVFREALKVEGFTLKSEIEMLKLAKKNGFVTFAFALSPEDAEKLAIAGVDSIILTVGWTYEITNIFEKRDRKQYEIAQVKKMMEAIDRTKKNPICIYFGGSIILPEDSADLYLNTNIHGYGGGGSFEQIPIGNLIKNIVKQFCLVPRKTSNFKLNHGLGKMVGSTKSMKKLFKLIKQIAPFDVNVCIEGESGVGKELVASELHRLSQRASNHFITLNCGAIPDSLLESELFGHEKGSFTGAVSKRIGKFELANGGTLLLDEIAELSPKGQVSLLRVLQQKEIMRVGGEKAIPVDVRIIAATHRNLQQMVTQEKFRADLYYRLNTITLEVPPLRYRIFDIEALVGIFLDELGSRFDLKVYGITPDFMKRLTNHSWPGNIRELKNVLCRAILLECTPILKGDDFIPESWSEKGTQNTGINAVLKAIKATNGNKSKAAEMLGISRKTLYSRLKQHYNVL